MPVQWVNRPNLDFRGFAGLIATGAVRPGDPNCVLPSGKTSRSSGSSPWMAISTAAWPGSRSPSRSKTRSTARAATCWRGRRARPKSPTSSRRTLVWMDDERNVAGRGYWLKLGTQMVSATVAELKYEIDVNTSGWSHTWPPARCT